MGDAALSNAEEKIHVRKSSVVADDRRESALIPTAIVKPKYQKLSFDERQLPIRGEAATITTTPRKVQKHLPKSQKSSFAKQNRKLMTTKSGEICSDFNVTDKMAINLNCRGERDIECNADSFDQQPRNNNININSSVAIVQPIKKFIDIIMSDDEKINVVEKEEIDYSINSESVMNKKLAPKNRNGSVENKFSLPNESGKISDCGIDNSKKCEMFIGSEDKKVTPTAASKKLQKIHSGN